MQKLYLLPLPTTLLASGIKSFSSRRSSRSQINFKICGCKPLFMPRPPNGAVLRDTFAALWSSMYTYIAHTCMWMSTHWNYKASIIYTHMAYKQPCQTCACLTWGHFDCSTCGDALLHIVSSFPLGRRFSSGLRLKRLSLEMLQHKQGLSVGKVSWLINICNASFSDTYFVIQKAR